MLAEKESELGGTTALSVGSLTAAGTRFQRRAGITDSVDAFVEDMEKFDPDLLAGDNPALRRLLANEANRTLEWLESLGVAFTGPYPEPPHRVPRMHNVIPNSRAYVARLAAAARRLGVDIRVGTRLLDLARAGDQWTATLCGADGRELTVAPVGGLVLAAGDFSGDEQMRRQYLPAAAAAARPANPRSSGDAQRIALTKGARAAAMDVTFGPQLRFPPPARRGLIERLPTWRWLCQAEAALVQRLPAAALRPFVKSLLITHMSPSAEMFRHGAILVNQAGERFCDEAVSTAALSSQPDGTGYVVFGARTAGIFNRAPNAISTAPGIAFAYFDDYRRGRPDLVHTASSAVALADTIGCDAETLVIALKDAGITPPLHALGPVFSMLTVTEGGLIVDDRLRVLDADGAPMGRLYAVGGAGQGGMMLKGHGHHIAWAMTSGRLAGAHAARSAGGQVP
jgi:fumarate reductase flavoprotein subunit